MPNEHRNAIMGNQEQLLIQKLQINILCIRFTLQGP